MEQVPRPARAGAWWPATGAAGEFPADPGPRPYGPDGRGGHGDGMTSFDGTRTEPRLRSGGSKVLRYAAAGATALMSLMNLPFAIDDGGAGTPAALAWLITLLGVAGLVAAIALLRGAGWAPWAVTAIGVVNLIGAAVALARDTEGAFIGLILSAVITALGAALVRARAGRAG